MRRMAWMKWSYIYALNFHLSLYCMSILYSTHIRVYHYHRWPSLSFCLLWMTVSIIYVVVSSICAAESSNQVHTFTFEWKIVVSSIFGQKDNSIFRCFLCCWCWSASPTCSATWRWSVPSSATAGPCSPGSGLWSPSSSLSGEIFIKYYHFCILQSQWHNAFKY